MKLISKNKIDKFKNSDVVAFFLTEEYKDEIDNQIPSELSFIKDKIDLSFFNGKPTDTLFIPLNNEPSIIIIGIGKKDKTTKKSLRNLSSNITFICRKNKIKTINVLLPYIEEIDELEILYSIAEGLSLSNYDFNKYKTEKNKSIPLLESAIFYSDKKNDVLKILKKINIISENIFLCRDMINESSEICNPLSIAKDAMKLEKMPGITCDILGEKELRKLKMGLLLAVSRGSKYSPQLVILKYKGDPLNKRSFALVGKGITFDSGGMNLKPSGHISDMRSDMAGAATSIFTLKAAAELKLKKNIIAVIPLCENMIGNNSYKPGDVFTAYNGKTVEIGNTDAEGRLILADALSYTEKNLKPNYIVDIATLTGACLVCFGEIIAGLLSNNDTLAECLYEAGEDTDDRVWRLPLHEEYDEDIKSDIADINNISSGRNAGTIIGAVFLKNFIKDTSWAHLDIAGTSWYSKQRGYKPKHATGYGIRLILNAIMNL